MSRVKKGRGGDSRERIVQTAARLLRVQGYHATGLNQIIEESEAPKGSLYHYFPEGKEELASEALQLAGRDMAERLRALLAEKPERALAIMVERSIQDLESTDFRDGCPLATVALETAHTVPQLRQLCASMFDGAVDIVAGWLRRQGMEAEKAQALAVTTFAAFEGAIMLSKARRDTTPLKTVGKQIGLLLGQELGR